MDAGFQHLLLKDQNSEKPEGSLNSIEFGKKLQTFAAKTLGNRAPLSFSFKKVSHPGQGLTAVEKIFNRNAVRNFRLQFTCRFLCSIKSNIVGSQDTTGGDCSGTESMADDSEASMPIPNHACYSNYRWLKQFNGENDISGRVDEYSYRFDDKANKRIDEIRSGEKPPLTPDENAKYFAEFVVDLDIIDEPMIADPDVNNVDASKRYTHDTIRSLSYYGGEETLTCFVEFMYGFIKVDIKSVSRCLKNLETYGERNSMPISGSCAYV
ncbi:hypothetical protein FQR65_LT17574 [Abscondita terminalis]|nr:hypothetical protein FQR65_LT17574 [Abscondita terminalis]